jgi:hypothetical protein
MAQTLAPKQAAALLGKSEETLRRWRVRGIGPPFVMEGGKPRYRSDLLEAGSYAVQGRQVVFPAPAPPEELLPELQGAEAASGQSVPVHRVVAMIERWKQRELSRRAQRVMDDPFAENEEFEDELRMFGLPWPEGRMEALADAVHDTDPTRRQAIFTSLDDLEAALSRKLRALWDAEGLPPSLLRASYQVASSLFEDAWREAVMAEARWRSFDYTGMPSAPPT